MSKKTKKIVRKNMTRRRFLHGALGGTAVTLGLPLFDFLFDGRGQALAQSGIAPVRFGTFFWGLGYGLDINHWIPSGEGQGSSWSIPSNHGLSGLSRHKDYLTIFSNYSHSKPEEAGHIPQRGVSVSASHNPTWVLDEGANGFREPNMPHPSIDALVEQTWNDTSTLLPFLNLTLDIGSLYIGTSSWGERGSHRNFRRTPSQVYNDVFRPLLSSGSGVTPLEEATYNLRKSVLDGTLEDLSSLKSQLSSTDRIRLEAHTEGVRALERKLSQLHELQESGSGEGTCSEAAEPTSDHSSASEITAKHDVMSDLMVYALSCNLTRIFCYEFSPTQCNGQIPEIGLTGPRGVHDDYSHDNTAGMRTYLSFTMDRLGTLLDKMRAIPEGAGTLLDHALVLGTAEYGGPHHHRGHPYLFAGKAGGGLRGNMHSKLSSTSNTAASQILLTAAHAVGAMIPSVGMPRTPVTGASGGPSMTANYQTSTTIPSVLT